MGTQHPTSQQPWAWRPSYPTSAAMWQSCSMCAAWQQSINAFTLVSANACSWPFPGNFQEMTILAHFGSQMARKKIRTRFSRTTKWLCAGCMCCIKCLQSGVIQRPAVWPKKKTAAKNDHFGPFWLSNGQKKDLQQVF